MIVVTFLIGQTSALADQAMFQRPDINMGWSKSVAWQQSRSEYASIADYDTVQDGHQIYSISPQTPSSAR